MKRRQRSFLPPSLIALTLVLLVVLISSAARAADGELASPATQGSAAQDGAEQAALAYVEDHHQDWGLTDADLQGLALVDQYVSQHNGLTHLYFWQTHGGLPVVGAMYNASVAADGRVIHGGHRLVGNLAARVNTTTPKLAADEAVHAAAAALKLSLTEPLRTIESLNGPSQEVLFGDGGISLKPIPAKLVFQPTEKGAVQLAWNVEIYELDAQHYWSMRIDALDGSLLEQHDYVVHDHWGLASESGDGLASAHEAMAAQNGAGPGTHAGPPIVESPDSYLVYAIPKEYPPDGPRTTEVNPAHSSASPFGWHDTDGVPGEEFTITHGNNVYAYTDTDANNMPDPGSSPDGGAGLNFSFPLDLNQEPAIYVEAAVTNLFYWNNVIHDVFYLYGFDEPAGNFQANNYGNGGTGNDAVLAEAHDGAGTNNANFFTPIEGQPPRMQMFLWNQTTPWRDGSLSSMVIAHEYGHGISNRLTGGPATPGCLSNAEQMGEGWSDFFGLALTANAADSGTTLRGVGTYVLGQTADGNGIRPTPYTTDMGVNPVTYGDLGAYAVPHGVGYVWASIIWEMYWALVDEYGFNPDIYGDWTTGGNNLALQLVVDGLKQQPCSPGFVDGRDAILAADVALTGGANQCLMWEAFAKRGLGHSASQGDPNDKNDGTEAFDIAPTCEFVEVQPAAQNICVGMPAAYTVTAGEGYTPPVTLSSSGAPVGTTTTFATNPLVTVPEMTTMTIANTTGVAAGTYDITVSGDDGVTTESAQVKLTVVDTSPGAPALVAPADGASDVPLAPSFAWSSAPEADTYLLEVDDDPAFGSIDYSTTLTTTTHVATSPLDLSTTYYWRVTAQNGCGSVPSAVYSLTTVDSTLACNGVPVDFEYGIPVDWTVLDASAGGAGIDWTTTADAACGIGNLTGGSGEAACADSDAGGPGSAAFDTQLTSPVFDLSSDHIVDASLDLRAYYRNLGLGDFFDIEIWSGGAWTNLLHWAETHDATDLSLDLSSYLGESGLQVRIRYAGDGWDWYAQVDDIALTCATYDVALSPDDQKSGIPGEGVVYTVQITNSGTIADTYSLAIAGHSWTTVLSAYTVSLAPGASTSVDVTVSVPANASAGDADTVAVSATSQTAPAVTATTALQTTATDAPGSVLYLPAFMNP